MKKIVLICVCLFALGSANAQYGSKKLAYSIGLGSGFAILDSDVNPLSVYALAEYAVMPRLYVGAGLGFSHYRRMMMPVFGSARWYVSRPRLFTPFLSCRMGYTVAFSHSEQGGFGYSPAVGVEYMLKDKRRVFLSVGYDSQKYQVLRRCQSAFALTEYTEKVSNISFSVTLGFRF